MRKCLNPIIAWMKFNNRTGKNELSGFINLRKQFENFGNGYLNEIQYFNDVYSGKDVILLPCRKCVHCQLNRSQEWSIRNTLESREYDENQCLFITLTYSDDNVNLLTKPIIDKNGNIYEVLSLYKPHLQQFIKNLRNVFKNNKIRFYGCGEYGGITFRPHYHLLIYGLSLDDIKYAKFRGKSYEFQKKYDTVNGSFYYSELLETCVWKKGFVDISTFSEFTASYVSRYCTKKTSDDRKQRGFLFFNGMQQQFNLMSLKPAIAARYAIKNLDSIFKDDEFIYHYDSKTMVLKPFKHWDKLYDIERPDEYKFIKENRKDFAKLSGYFDSLETNLNISNYLRNIEDISYKKLKERSKV